MNDVPKNADIIREHNKRELLVNGRSVFVIEREDHNSEWEVTQQSLIPNNLLQANRYLSLLQKVISSVMEPMG